MAKVEINSGIVSISNFIPDFSPQSPPMRIEKNAEVENRDFTDNEPPKKDK